MIVVRRNFGSYGKNGMDVPAGDKPPPTPLPGQVAEAIIGSNADPASIRERATEDWMSEVGQLGAPVGGRSVDDAGQEIQDIIDPNVGIPAIGDEGAPQAEPAPVAKTWFQRHKWTILAIGGGTIVLTALGIIVAKVTS
jgi:hypothetical protein